MKYTLRYGIIAGIIVSVFMLISMNYLSHCEGNVDYKLSLMIGYASMFLAFSLVFIGIKKYRDKINGGTISFGRAFKVGIIIVLIASTMYVVSWLVFYFFFMPDFMDKYNLTEIENLKAAGASAAEIETKSKEMADFVKLYKNPFFNALMTYAEILPVGLLVTIVSSLILKRKKPLI